MVDAPIDLAITGFEDLEIREFYDAFPPVAKDYANRAYQCLAALNIRNFGAMSRAELAVKITRWLMEHETGKEINEP